MDNIEKHQTQLTQ